MRFFSGSSSAEPSASRDSSPPRSRNRSRSQSVAQAWSGSNTPRRRLQRSRSRSQSVAQPIPFSTSSSPARSRLRTRSTSAAQTPASPPQPGFSICKSVSPTPRSISSPPTIFKKAATSKNLEKLSKPLSRSIIKPLEELVAVATSKASPSIASTNASYHTTATSQSAIANLLASAATAAPLTIIENYEGNATCFEKNEDKTMAQPDQEKMQAFLEKFDPGVSSVKNIGDRDWMQRMYANNLLWCAAKLQRHAWVEGSEVKIFKELCKEDRRESIHEDLMRYTEALKAYDDWQRSTDQTPEADVHTYGRTLAILECASKHDSSNPLITHISSALSRSLSSWSDTPLCREESVNSTVKLEKVGIVQRMHRIEMSSMGVLLLLVPILLLVLHPIITTMFCVFVTGGLLAVCVMDTGEKLWVNMASVYTAVMKSLWSVDKYDYPRGAGGTRKRAGVVKR